MQNWNQWQVPAGTVTAPMPPTPAGFAAPGADPMAMMQSYMQYYNQPAPSGYTSEQWASAQQQNWTQWQQWQQQFQQWQAQYGEKYQETMKQLSAQGLSLPNIAQAPPLPSSQPPPPLPKEDHAKPPLPPDGNNPYQYSNMPPPNQNNLPLFPSKSQSGDYNRGASNYAQPPLPPGQPPLPASNPREPSSANLLGEKRGNNEPLNSGSAKKNKVQSEELTEAEKTFDAQFKQWEEQFNKWKQQNANHPDKTQYKQYEAKWTSWREKLIERREQMRKKREQQKQSAKVDTEKTKGMSGGDKILNLLSSSENQGLLNNLLGIGKTLGLTGKQDADRASTSSASSTLVAPLPPTQPAPSLQPAAMAAPTMTTDMNQAAWAAQQWAAQYNVTMGLQNYGAFPMVPGMAPPVAAMPQPLAAMAPPAPPAAAASFPQQSGNHYSQPPPSLANSGMNFSQPPPGFGGGDSRQMPGPGMKQNQQNAPPPLFGSDGDKRDGFGGNDQFSQSNDRFRSSDNRSDRDNDQRFGSNDRGDSANQFSSGNYRFGRDAEFGGSNRGGGNQFGSENDRFNEDGDRFGGNRQRDFGSNERSGLGNQFRENDSFAPRNDRFRPENDRFGSNEDGDAGNQRFSRDNDSFAPSNDRFGSNDRAALGSNRLGRNLGSFGSGNDRFGSSNDRLGSDMDRSSSNTDRFGSNSAIDQFGPGSKDRFGPGNDRFGSNNDRLSLGNDRFDSGNSHFGSGSGKDNFIKSHGFNDSFGSGTDRFNRSDRSDNTDHLDSKDLNYTNDNRNNSFGDNSRGLNRNTRPFESSDSIAPELKKLMEKRRTAMNVFKPRDDTFNPVKQDNIGSLSESFKKITGELPYAGRNPGDVGPKSLLGLGPRGPDSSISRGPGDFGTRGSDNLMSRRSGDFGPRGLDNFMSRGPGDFGPRGPDNPISRGPGDFGPRGSDNAMSRGPGDFGLRGSDNAMSRGPGDFGPRGSDNTMSRGPGDFGPRGSDNPMSRGPGDFGPRGSDNAMSRGGPGDFGPRGSDNAMSRGGPGDFGPRGSDNAMSRGGLGNFGPRGSDNAMSRGGPGDFGPRGSDNAMSRSGPGDFGPRGSDNPMSRGPGDFGPRGSDNTMSRGPGEFGSRGLGSFQGNNNLNQQAPRGMEFGSFPHPGPLGPSGPDKFRPSGELGGPKIEFGPPRGQESFGPQGRGDLEHNKEGSMVDEPGEGREVSTNIEPSHGLDNRGKDQSQLESDAVLKDAKLQPEPSSEILPLERPPWMDAQFPGRNLSDNLDQPKPDALFPNSSSQNEPESSGKAINMELEESNDIMEVSVFDKNGREISKTPNQQANEIEKPSQPPQQSDRSGKDQNTLPFMGENDPKPEDLNMEPPPELPNLGPITETPNLPAFRSNIQDSDRPPRLVTQRGPNSPFFDASGPPLGPFRPGGLMDQFGQRGPGGNRFDFRPPADRQFGPLGPHFGQRGPNDTQFGPRGLNESHFGPRGSLPFDAKGIHDNHMNMMNQRSPNDGILGSRPGEEHLGPMGRGFPAPTGPIGNQFGPRPMNNPPLLQRSPNDGQFRPRGPNESMFGPRGPNPGQKSAIPSLLGLQFDKQPNFNPSNPPSNTLNKPNTDFMASGSSLEENKTIEGRRSLGVNEPDLNLPFKMDQRPPFGPGPPFPPGRLPGPEQRSPFASGGVEQRSIFERDAPLDAGQRPPFLQSGPLSEQRPLNRPGGQPLISPHSQGGPEQRPPFIQGGPRGLDENSKPSMGSGGLAGFETRMDQRAPFMPGRQGSSDQTMGRGREQRMGFDDNFRGNDGRSPFSEPRKGLNDPLPGPNNDSGFYNRSQDLGDRRKMQRDSAVDEFRVGKQFNYNHGGSAMDKKISEVIPGKVIDYGHMTKVIIHEYITPAQCFDYGHGNLKPEVPEHEVVPQRDFRHWEETEQSLKEYDDRLRLFASEHEWQCRPKVRDPFKFERPESREREHSRTDRRSFESDDRRLMDKDNKAKRERDHKEEHKDRERDRERDRESARESEREDRSWKDGNDQKERNRDRNERSERSDRMRTDQSKEHSKDDDRSKGNVSRQEYQNKSNANTSSLESSTSEAKNETSETAPTKMELPRMPNYTMVDDIISQPGRQTRPPKIVIILRGPPGSGKSFVAKLIKDKEVEQGGSAPRILSLDDYFLVEKEKETKDDNGKKVVTKEMVYEFEEAMELSYLTSLVKAFKKNITDGYFNFIILDCINEKISDYEEMWSFAKTKGFQVYVCEMEMDVHICMKRNIHNRTEEEINKIVDYFEPTPSHHLKLDVNGMLQEEAIDEVHMEDSQTVPEDTAVQANDDSQDSQDDKVGVSKWEKMDADNKLDRLDGLAKKKNESRPQTMEDFLQVPDYYNMEDTPGKKRVRWADLEERKEQEKLRAVGFVVGHTNWDRMMDPTKGQSALTRTKYI